MRWSRAFETGVEEIDVQHRYFFLLINEQLNHSNLSQTVVMTRDTAARERVLRRLRQRFQTDFPQLRGRISRLDVGPPLEYPVMFRVLGAAGAAADRNVGR